jgi:hypothetical protein
VLWAGEVGRRVSVRAGGHSFDGFPLDDDVVLIDPGDLAGTQLCALRSWRPSVTFSTSNLAVDESAPRATELPRQGPGVHSVLSRD